MGSQAHPTPILNAGNTRIGDILLLGLKRFRIAAMRHANPLTALALLVALGLGLMPVRARAQDALQNASRLPDWKGQWIRVGPVGFDPSKPGDELIAEFDHIGKMKFAIRAYA